MNILINLLFASSIIFTGVSAEGFDISDVERELQPLATKLSDITGYPESEVLYEIFGELHFVLVEQNNQGLTCWAWLKCYGNPDDLSNPLAHGLLIHELGHRFINDLHLGFKDLRMNNGYYDEWGNYVHVTGLDAKGNYLRTNLGYPHGGRPYEQHGVLFDDYHTYGEDFADTFMNWTLDQCTDDEAGRVRCGWMDSFVRGHIKYNSDKNSINSPIKIILLSSRKAGKLALDIFPE